MFLISSLRGLMRDNMQLTAGFKNLMIGFIPFLLAGLNETSITILSVFLLLDVITGVISTIRIDGIKKLSSRTFSFGILFKFMILLVPLIVVWTGKGIGLDLLTFAIWAINMLIVSEALSILGNISAIKTGERVKEIDALNLIITKFKNILTSFLERESK